MLAPSTPDRPIQVSHIVPLGIVTGFLKSENLGSTVFARFHGREIIHGKKMMFDNE